MLKSPHTMLRPVGMWKQLRVMNTRDCSESTVAEGGRYLLTKLIVPQEVCNSIHSNSQIMSSKTLRCIAVIELRPKSYIYIDCCKFLNYSKCYPSSRLLPASHSATDPLPCTGHLIALFSAIQRTSVTSHEYLIPYLLNQYHTYSYP